MVRVDASETDFSCVGCGDPINSTIKFCVFCGEENPIFSNDAFAELEEMTLEEKISLECHAGHPIGTITAPMTMDSTKFDAPQPYCELCGARLLP